jgi:hypothetical protein
MGHTERKLELGRIGVANREHHYLSQFEIDGAKRISQHLSKSPILASIQGYGRASIDEIYMNRLKLVVTLFALLCLGGVLVRAAQEQLTIDATKQPSPPARGRGPYAGSTNPGHAADLPIRLELFLPTNELRSDQTALVDFIITNVGTEPVTLPISVDQNTEDETSVLTLWLTSDAIRAQYAKDQQTGRVFKVEIVGTSAELYGGSNNRRTLHVLAPNESCRVHASSRVLLNPGSHSITAHAELLRVLHGRSELVGTADSVAVRTSLHLAENKTSR